MGRRKKLQHRQDSRHSREPNPDNPFDEFGFRIGHLAPYLGNVGLCRDIRQVDVDRLLDGGCERFGLRVREACSRRLFIVLCVSRALIVGARLAALELRDKEDLAAFADWLEEGGLVDLTVDRDGRFFDEVLAETGVEAVHFPDDATQVFGFDREFPHAAGIAAAEPGREQNPRGHRH
jgi:hypothetical protein